MADAPKVRQMEESMQIFDSGKININNLQQHDNNGKKQKRSICNY